MGIAGSEHNKALTDKDYIALAKIALFGNTPLANDMIQSSQDFIIADSLDELAQKMNALSNTQDLDVETMKRDIRAYDAMIHRGKKFHNDDQLRRIQELRRYTLDRIRTCNFQPIEDESAKPYVAIRQFITTRKTLGGIQTDLRSRVTQKHSTGLNPDVIPCNTPQKTNQRLRCKNKH